MQQCMKQLHNSAVDSAVNLMQVRMIYIDCIYVVDVVVVVT